MKILNKLYPALFTRAFAVEATASLLRAPVIYYSSGLKFASHVIYQQLRWLEQLLGIGLTIRTLGTPMYGDYTLSGRAVGFFVRLVLLFAKGLAFLMLAFLAATAFVLYGVLPFLVIYLIFK